MMRALLMLGLAAVLGTERADAATAPASAAPAVILSRTASAHPMQYLLSRPAHWDAAHTWPVVVIIADARREYRAALQEFVSARGERPYVLVCPVTLTSGGDAHRIRELFSYPDSAWARASRDGDCTFDRDGLTAVLADVQRLDHGDARVFMTGLEAAGHVEWAEVLLHPERLRAVTFTTPNYIGRCVEEAALKPDPAAAKLALRVYSGDRDTLWSPKYPFRSQWSRGRALAENRGVNDISEALVPGASHDYFASQVLAWFDSLRTR